MALSTGNENHTSRSKVFEFSKYLQNSSVPALYQLGSSKLMCHQVFWFLVFALCFAGFSFEVYTFFRNYFQYNVIETIEVETLNRLFFPSVTLCNLNRITKMVSTTRIILPASSTSTTEQPILEFKRSERIFHGIKNAGYLSKDELLIQRKRAFDFLNDYTAMVKEIRRFRGHQYDRFIMTCSFDNTLCGSDNFTFFQSLQYGNCFTFMNKDGDDHRLVSHNQALELELNLEIDDYEDITDSIGARVVIHEPYEDPNPEDYGVNIKPGFETSISLERKQKQRLPHPYRDQCRDYHKENQSQQLCLRTCIQNLTLSWCSCVDPTFDIEDDVVRCDLNNETQFLCMNEVLDKITKQSCSCPLPCLSVEYGMVLSHAVWPAREYFEDRIKRNVFSRRQKYSLNYDIAPDFDHDFEYNSTSGSNGSSDNVVKKIYFLMASIKAARKTYAKLRVHYGTTKVTTHKQTAMFQSSELFGHLGGQMGLWLGVSVVVLFEIMEGVCSSSLGLSSNSIPDQAITSLTSDESTPSAGRINNKDGSWCFNNNSVQSQSAVLTIDLGDRKFLSGLASQGPPESLKPKSYSHLLAFAITFSLDSNQWLEFNGGNMFFDTDKDTLADAINFHAATTIVLARYARINVTLHVYGPDTVCLRFELYGCNQDVQPVASIQATTTTKGRIEVQWNQPSADNTLKDDASNIGFFSPSKYTILYQPLQGEKKTMSSNRKDALLDDVRLGATYVIELQCQIDTVILECGKTQIEAYPPCPENWSGGNEYHCFWLLGNLPFPDIRKFCLNELTETLGPLGAFVDEEEQKFISSRILPKDTSSVWIVGEKCQEKEDCCQIATTKSDGTMDIKPCESEQPGSALCIRDHKGEGSRLRVSSVSSLVDGTGIIVVWRYEGDGWKTDELQMKLWKEGQSQKDASTLGFSTLFHEFRVPNLEISTTYRFLLRPAPNIRTLEKENGFTILEFPDGASKYGAFLTPVLAKGYILWSGILRVTWSKAEAKIEGDASLIRNAEKYVVIPQQMAPLRTLPEIELTGDELEYKLTPVAIESEYNFQIKCFYLGVQYHCANVTIVTDPPDLARKFGDTCYVYDLIDGKPKNWSVAEDDCEQRSGHLLSILDENEGKDVLELFPSIDSVLWTGAKLRRGASGYWTDGTKITDLPMAKTSGVTSSAEACCRALNEFGRLRLSGSNCSAEFSYICKYKVEKLINEPEAVAVKVESWNTIQVTWGMWKDSWFPSEVVVYVCPAPNEGPTVTSCDNGVVDSVAVAEITTVTFITLAQFTVYDVCVQAWLSPLDIKTEKTVRIMTHPKNPVEYVIAQNGMMVLTAPMLVATNRKDLIIEATLTPIEDTSSPAVEGTGSVNEINLKGLVPGQKYRMDLKTQSEADDWTHVQECVAEPTCAKGEVQIDTQCYGSTGIQEAYDAAKISCTKQGKIMWNPQSIQTIKNVASSLASGKDFWFDLGSATIDVKQRQIGSCDLSKEKPCCFFKDKTSDVICSCCNAKLSTLCSYTVNSADLQKVQQLATTTITYTSFIVKWTAPETSWLINKYEIQYSKEDSPSEITTKMAQGVMELQLEGLESGTNYIVNVRPYGTASMKGESSQITTATLDPNPPLAVSISENGIVQVTSPRLKAKGRSEEAVKVEIFEVESPSQMRSVGEIKGQAKNVTFDGLKPGGNYVIKIKTEDEQKKDLDSNSSIMAYPSCQDNQVQVGLSCVWISEKGSKPWPDASSICKTEGEKMFLPKSKKQLISGCPELQAKVDGDIWIDVSNLEMQPNNANDVNSQCSGDQQQNNGIACCSCDALAGKDGIVCSCCQDSKLFACQSPRKVNIGEIEVGVQEITSNSVRLVWKVVKASAWGKPTFEVNWREKSGSSRKKRATNRILVEDTKATVEELKAGTPYVVRVAPTVDDTPMGKAAEITVTTRDSKDYMAAGFQAGEATCTMSVLKIIGSCFVIAGTGITIFIFIVTRMLYFDCSAHICANLALLAAYMCILVASCTSYSGGNECSNADPTLCVAVAVLIQYFFQVAYLCHFLEVLEMSSLLDSGCLPQNVYLPSRSLLLFCGWGIPGIILIVSAAVASDDFSDGNDNCWLNLNGNAVYPSVIPVIVFASLHFIFLLPVMLREQNPKETLSPYETKRAKVLLRVRWVSIVLLVMVTVCWLSGMMGSGTQNLSWNITFALFSIVLGVLIPLLRIRVEEQVKEQLKLGLFSAYKEETRIAKFRVTPTFVVPHERPTSSRMTGYLSSNKMQDQKTELAQFFSLNKKVEDDNDVIWHR